MKPYVYIVIRKDIRPENYAPQIAHAALEGGSAFGVPEYSIHGSTHIVILEVQDKMELEMVALSLQEEGISFEEFHEGFASMGFTALATEVIEKPENSCLCSLKLFKY